ncbi:MAG: pyridoxamine kinase [Angelakisella sp.]|nr:pyridoxamine kinase [Angelakisella sp.]
MANQQLRVAAIHDLSGFGRCSLSVILPVMSVMGVQVCPIPTAVLSTHTGGFGDVALRDLTDYMEPCLEHYRALKLEMDCVYTGYLSSVEQVEHCLSFFDCYGNALKVVDPVMGDHGKLYRSFTSKMVEGIRSMVCRAHVITPNLTEAMILLGEEPAASQLTTSQARSLLARLSKLGPQRVVITGVTLATGEYANLCYDSQHNSYWKSVTDYLPVRYPGTGDIFAAVLTASLLQGDSLPMAMDRATRYVELTIKTTYSYSTDSRQGVMLEQTLPWLTQHEVPRGYLSL